MNTAIKVKERPIIFSSAMVRAILEGRQTQTRRVLKPQPQVQNNGHPYPEPWNLLIDWKGITDYSLAGFSHRCPYGQSGDRLWVRETWWTYSGSESVHYSATEEAPKLSRHFGKVHSSIFMPRWASRITLEVTEVRVQRVQEISEEDAVAEGIEPITGTYQHIDWENMTVESETHPITCRYQYGALWDSINGKKYPWKDNPWVWAVSFKRV